MTRSPGRPAGSYVFDLETMLLIYPSQAKAKEAYERLRELGVSYLFTCVGQGRPLYGARYSRARVMVSLDEEVPHFWEWINEAVRCRLTEQKIREG